MEFIQKLVWYSVLFKTTFSAQNITTESIKNVKPMIRYVGDFDVSMTLENVNTKFPGAKNSSLSVIKDVFKTTLDDAYDTTTDGSFKEEFDETKKRQDISFKIRYTFKSTDENIEFLPNETAVNLIKLVGNANKSFQEKVKKGVETLNSEDSSQIEPGPDIVSVLGFDETTFSKRKNTPIKLKKDENCFQRTLCDGCCSVKDGDDTCVLTHFGKLCIVKTCETMINDGSNPCNNKGKCSENQETGKIECKCVDGWKNDFCDGRTCNKDGTKKDNNQNCDCKDGWTGLDCEKRNDCQNGASLNGVVCECLDGFTGSLCENELDVSGGVNEANETGTVRSKL